VLTKISGRHMEITEALRTFVEKKISRLKKHYDRISEIEVVVNAEGDQHKVELIVNADNTQPFVVRESGQDMYACLDIALDKCERQLTRHKEKSRDRKHRMGAAEATADIIERKDQREEQQ
jgi:putative sigma-54 modulation protein